MLAVTDEVFVPVIDFPTKVEYSKVLYKKNKYLAKINMNNYINIIATTYAVLLL